jgi:SAM-dependent methyltransferase
MVAVDAAPRMVGLLARNFPAVESHVMDAAALEFPGPTFDLVVAGFVVHILPDPVAAVAEVRRALRPGDRPARLVRLSARLPDRDLGPGGRANPPAAPPRRRRHLRG